MPGQEQQHATSNEVEEETPTPDTPTSAQAQDFAVDDLLDEIDDVLEVNAESFVKGFVQKGGQ
ncbi:ubiquitin-like protein Pup [Populibacterium corticicola]|uniref:Prokaryotic ubiquitin-like protein Pup n=1 Tax=Populibacterium corticicola TaxID=1812826 RepID=A0ABW5XCM5_9MICO